MKLLTLLFCLTITHGSLTKKVRYDNYKLYKITPKTAHAVETLHGLETASEFNFWSGVGPVGIPAQVMVPPYKVSQLEDMATNIGMELEVMMENVQDQIDAEANADEEEEGFGWKRYHTLAEINQWLFSLVEEFPDILTLLQVNGSYEGRTIYGLKLSYGLDKKNSSVFIESTIHAREWITAATTTYIFNELLRSNETAIRDLAESHDWYFFPVFNPDGYEYSHTTDRMWRKTRVPHSILCIGADPNRNWAHFWNTGGTSNSPCTEIYRGPHPFSEPSCRAMSEFISTIGYDLVAYISFHSFSQMLLIPYGYTPEHLDNYDLIYEVGLKAAEALRQRYGTEYVVGTVYETIYPASGSSPDWVKGVFNTSIVYTYELRDLGRYGFLLPPDQIIPTAEETLDSFVTIFEEYYARTDSQK